MEIFEGIFDFLKPDFTDFIQLPFFILIMVLTLGTMLLTWFYGREKNWQRRWDKGVQANSKYSIDTENSSAQEVCYALASKPEKVAEIMPGILLICGLLGTFIGLGISIDKASSVLSDASTGMDGMGNAMDDLLLMLEGLGTKFKASTWGILGFLVLRAYLSYLDVDGKRLQWVSKKIKDKLDMRAQAEHEKQEQTHLALLNAVALLGDRICEKTSSELLANRGSLIENQKILQEQLNCLQETKKITANLFDRNNTLIDIAQANNKQILAIYQLTHDENKNLLNTIAQSNKSTAESIVHSINGSVDTLSGCIDKNSNAVAQEIKLTNRQIGEQQKTLQEQLKSNQGVKKSVDDLLDANLSHIEVLRESSNKMQFSSEKMAGAADGIASAAENIGSSSTKLGVVIDGFSDQVTNVLDGMKSDLTTTIAEMSTSFDKNIASAANSIGESSTKLGTVIDGFSGKITNVLDEMNHGLAQTIDAMGSSFQQNMDNVSNTLASATSGIENAVENLSSNVEQTMGSVNETTKEASKLQKEMGLRFNQTSDNLNLKVASMTELVDDLKEQIIEGLSAISVSNRNVSSLNKRYNGVSEIAEENNKNMKELFILLKSLNDKNDILAQSLQGVIREGGVLSNLLKEQSKEGAVLNNAVLAELKSNFSSLAEMKQKEHQIMNLIKDGFTQRRNSID